MILAYRPPGTPVTKDTTCLAHKTASLTGEGQPCQFPFVYLGRTYHTCIDRPAKVGEFWCPTRLLSNSEITDHSPYWGYCSESCAKKHLYELFPSRTNR